MFNSLFNLAKDVCVVAAAPVEVVADLARVVTKPAADAAQEVATAVKEVTQDLSGKG